MNREDVIRIAEYSGFRLCRYNAGKIGVVDSDGADIDDELERFAALVEVETLRKAEAAARYRKCWHDEQRSGDNPTMHRISADEAFAIECLLKRRAYELAQRGPVMAVGKMLEDAK